MRDESSAPVHLYAFFLCLCLALLILEDKPLVRIASGAALLATTMGVIASRLISSERLRIAMWTIAVLALASIAFLVTLRHRHGGSAVDGSCSGPACYVVSRGQQHNVTRSVYMRIAATEIAIVSLVPAFMGLGLSRRE